jgi:hypothetical protein
VSPEPVSPELVLVDPELAERERSRMREKAALELYLATHPPPAAVQWSNEPVAAVAQRAPSVDRPRLTTRDLLRKRLLPAALVVSVFANGYLASDLVLRADREASTAVAVAVRPAASAAPTLRTSPPAPRRVARKTIVEQKLVSLVLSAPARKLPRAFIDPKTGLVRNNVQVSCRAAKRRSYLCTVGLASAHGSKALIVRYRTTRAGRDQFAWHGYKSVK